MDREIQDQVWKSAPKAFRKAVKAQFNLPTTNDYEQGYDNALVSLFGHHNLTSDEEPEEMCIISRTNVEALHSEIHKAIMDAHDADDWQDAAHYILDLLPRSFNKLFGYKCLPDDADAKAEPKLKVGDRVIHNHPNREIGEIVEYFPNEKFCYSVRFGEEFHCMAESQLLPYTKPTEVAHEDNFASKEPKSDDMEEKESNPYRDLYSALCELESASIKVRKALVKFTNNQQ